MTERSWLWGGTTIGDAALPEPYGAPYNDDMFSDLYAMLFTRDRASQGVIVTDNPSYSGLLQVTHSGGTTLSVASGIAMVDGKIFASDAAVTFNTSGNGTYYVVARKTWNVQTVRLALVTSVVQLDGVTWDLPLATIVVSGATHTITDTRGYAISGSSPQFLKRVGGALSSWSIGGSTVYDTGRVQMFQGVLTMSANEGTYFKQEVLVFPRPFSKTPIVLAWIGELSSGTQPDDWSLKMSIPPTASQAVFIYGGGTEMPFGGSVVKVYWQATGEY
jgi:hypothetical protein